MDWIASVALAGLALALLVIVHLRGRARGEAERRQAAETELQAVKGRLDAAVAQSAADLAARTAAETSLAGLEARLAEESGEKRAALVARDAALRAEAEAARQADLMRQTVAEAERRMADFERLKKESLESARAAVLDTAQKLSSKLLEDHKRENEEAKKAGEARVKEATETLMKRFEEVTEAVARIKGDMASKGEKLDNLWRALTSPGGSGHFAEIGLANTFKAFGLVEGRDYLLQATTSDAQTGRRLRPDALVFLPGDGVLVVDCKASKFLVEIAASEGGDGEAEAYAAFGRTMNTHLRQLAEKDYRAAVAAAMREAGRPEAARVLSIMCLPNESAIERLQRADPEFMAKAARFQIVPAGPAGLAGFIGFAAVEIAQLRQAENQEKIVQGAERLLEGAAIALGHAAAVGKGLKGAADAYEKFARSVNGTLLPRARTLGRLGLRPAKPIPASLAVPHVNLLDSVIEGEAEEVEPTPLLAQPTGT